MTGIHLVRDVMETNTRLAALAGAVLLVMAAIAPFAVAATTAGNAAGNVAVETHDATDVTNNSATLNGELTEVPEDENATVYFTYWEEGESENATETESGTHGEPATFHYELTGLEENTTYVYVANAEANGTEVSGDQVTFTTGGEDERDENATDAFGLEVSAFVHSLLEDRDDDDRGIGQMVSAFVTANNPGADHRPDHAGPPEDRGEGASDDKRQGPPEDKGPNAQGADDRPDHANDDEADDADDEDEPEAQDDETATETEA